MIKEFKSREFMFANIRWVLKALSKNKEDLRPFKHNAYVKNGEFVVTDGIRIHKYTLPGNSAWKEGFYKIIKNNKSHIILQLDKELSDAGYPDYKDLFKQEDITVKFDSCTINTGAPNPFDEMVSCTFTKIIKSFDENTINYEFVKDILSGEETFEISIKDHTSSVHFIFEDRHAVIMPIRFNAEEE